MTALPEGYLRLLRGAAVASTFALGFAALSGSRAADRPAQTKTGFYYPTLTVNTQASRVATPFLAGSRGSTAAYPLTTGGEPAVHSGVDISAPLGDPVFALADGEVDVELSSLPRRGFGWDEKTQAITPGGVLVAKHQFRDQDGTVKPFYAVYGHLNYERLRAWLDDKGRASPQSRPGQPVVTIKAGEEIGRIGPWNPRWGLHLHLAIRRTKVPPSGWGMLPKSSVDKPDGTTDRLGWEDPWEFIHLHAPASTSPSHTASRAPRWPGDETAQFSIPGAGHFFAADLNGRGAQDLAFVYDSRGRGLNDEGKTVAVYRWDGRFQRIAQTLLPLTWQITVGDGDLDGREELHGVSSINNALLTMSLIDGQVRRTGSQVLTTSLIGSVAFSDFRRTGVPELLLAVDSRQSFRSQGDPQCNLLLAYKWTKGGWVRSWRWSIKQRGYTLDIRPGQYAKVTGAGRQLLFEHGPSDVSGALHELWRWDGSRLLKAGECSSVSDGPSGLQHWVGVVHAAPDGGSYIASRTIYLSTTPSGDETPLRGELLLWGPKAARAVFTLPGAPMVLGRFRPSGRRGVVVSNGGGVYTLLEPPVQQATPRSR